MTPELWKTIVELAEAAADLARDKRRAFLAEACAGDEALRTEAESLIASDQQRECVIDAPVFRTAAELIADNQAASMAGQTVGAYKIVDLLGMGGMGEVYLAEDTRLGRKAALKFLPGYFTSDRTWVRRFEQEARAASALNHPNILTVYEVGESADTRFIAAEFVEGKTLRQQMESVQMAVGEVLDVAIQVASALGVAHEAGIVHRDIKPENIMLRPDGYIKVLDFGLAKVSRQRRSMVESDGLLESDSNSQTGLVFGTPHYMSPEQARGEGVDLRTDIFSLGAVIYEMLTGRKPFEGETTSHVVVAILEKDPPPLSELSPGLPSDLDRVVTKALRKDRLARYQTAADLIADLKSLKQRLQLDAQSAPALRERRRPIAGGELSQDGRARGQVGQGGASNVKRRTLSGRQLISEVRHYWRSLALSSLAIAGAAASIIYFSTSERRNAIDSVAILPFTSATDNPDAEYLADGIADHLTNSLSRLSGLTVISSRAASRYKVARPEAAGPDIQAVGHELKVRAVVAGTVVQRGDRVYVDAELIDARNNRHLWGRRYDRKAADIFGMQEEIASGISEALRSSFSGQNQGLTAKHHTESTEAYQAYLKGRHFWNQRTNESLQNAIQFFDQAIGIDPSYGAAYAGLGDSYQLLTFYSGLSPATYSPRARAAAERAIAIDDELAEAHTTLAYVEFYYDWDWTAAEAEFKRAIELNPNYATAHQWYGEFLGNLGRIDESLAERNKALTLDPLSPIISSELGDSYYEARQYDRAVEEFRKAAKLYPDFSPAHSFLAMGCESSGLYDEALAEIQRAIDLFKNDVFLALRARILARSGKRREARQALAEVTNESKQRFLPPTLIARVYAALGDKEQAFELLDKAYTERDWGLVALRVDPTLDDLRSDPRFSHLLKRMNLSQ